MMCFPWPSASLRAIVEDNEDLLRKIAALRPNDTVRLRVWRNKQEHLISARLAKVPSSSEHDKITYVNTSADKTKPAEPADEQQRLFQQFLDWSRQQSDPKKR